jgi:hypothetical protein
MSNEFKIIRTHRPGELEKLALGFHQDFEYDGDDFDLGIERHVRMLNADRIRTLHEELSDMLGNIHDEASARAKWKTLGAAWIPRELKLLQKLRGVLVLLTNKIEH